ncbi:MAG: hypothetical protein MJ252_09180, partial [archaeon]|nr:hypothetical protein [archaeon]
MSNSEIKFEREKKKSRTINQSNATQYSHHKALYLNKTCSDSLNDILVPVSKTNTSPKKKNFTKKIENFYDALDSIKQKINFSDDSDIADISESICTENTKNGSKKNNISQYIERPIIQIHKEGNGMFPKIKPNKFSIKFSDLAMPNIIETDSEEEDNIIEGKKKEHLNNDLNKDLKDPKNSRNKEKERNTNLLCIPTNNNTLCYKETDINTFEINKNKILINDLDLDQDIKIKNYTGKDKLKHEIDSKEDKKYFYTEGVIIDKMDKEKNEEKIYILDSINDQINNEDKDNNEDSLIVSENINESIQSNSTEKEFIQKDLIEFMGQDAEENVAQKISFESDLGNDEDSLDDKNYLGETINFYTPKNKIKPFEINIKNPKNSFRNTYTLNFHRYFKSNNFKKSLSIFNHKYSSSNLTINSVISMNSLNKNILHIQQNSMISMNGPKNTMNNFYENVSVFDTSFLQNLINKDLKYSINVKEYLMNINSNITKIRKEVILWLMVLCEEFAFKRDTFHYSVYNLERYISKNNSIKRKEYFLSGLACLSISAKIEEIQIPKLNEYITTINTHLNSNYTNLDLIEKEREILISLTFLAIPNTLNTWLSWHLSQWDLFIDSMEGIKEMFLTFCENEENIPYFKRKDDLSYYNFRRSTQLIDFYLMDIKYLQYNTQYLVMGAIYSNLLICYNNGEWMEIKSKGGKFKEIFIKFIE